VCDKCSNPLFARIRSTCTATLGCIQPWHAELTSCSPLVIDRPRRTWSFEFWAHRAFLCVKLVAFGSDTELTDVVDFERAQQLSMVSSEFKSRQGPPLDFWFVAGVRSKMPGASLRVAR